MKNHYNSLTLIGILILGMLTACLKIDDEEPPIVCDPVDPVAGFRVVDETSGADLFFSATPTYQPKEFYAFKTKDVARQDTIKPRVYGNDTFKAFILSLDFSKSRDTLITKIGDTPDDQLVYTVKGGTGFCGGKTLDQVFFNGKELQRDEDGIFLLKK